VGRRPRRPQALSPSARESLLGTPWGAALRGWGVKRLAGIVGVARGRCVGPRLGRVGRAAGRPGRASIPRSRSVVRRWAQSGRSGAGPASFAPGPGPIGSCHVRSVAVTSPAVGPCGNGSSGDGERADAPSPVRSRGGRGLRVVLARGSSPAVRTGSVGRRLGSAMVVLLHAREAPRPASSDVLGDSAVRFWALAAPGGPPVESASDNSSQLLQQFQRESLDRGSFAEEAARPVIPNRLEGFPFVGSAVRTDPLWFARRSVRTADPTR
jgi:hypothetical protein